MSSVLQHTFNIADAGTVSNGVDLNGELPVGVHIPTGFDGTTLGFQAAETTVGGVVGTYRVVKDSTGADVSLTVAAGRFVQIAPTLLAGVRFLKLVAGTQTGAVNLYLVTRPG